VNALLGLLCGFLSRYWYLGALFAVSALAWHLDSRAVANADAVRIQAEQFKETQAAAAAIAQEALANEQAMYNDQAQKAQKDYESHLEDAHSYAAAYIASHRVQSAAAKGSSGSTSAPAKGDSSELPAVVPTDSVVVSTSDLQACTSSVTYAIDAHNWAVTIKP